MDASIITIGDEILIGQIVDTNSAFLASALNSAGVRVHRLYSISDKEKDIINTLDEAIQTTDIIVITGGLGPTNDDVTKVTLTKYFKGKLIEHHETLKVLERIAASRGIELSDRNRAQAMVPDACEVLLNRNGTAPGMLFRKHGKWIVSLPGVPYEMKALFTEEFLPVLKKESSLPVRLNKSVCIAGIPESALADKLKSWEESLPENVEIAYLPTLGLIRLRISLSGDNYDHLNKKLHEYSGQVYSLLGPKYVLGQDEDTLPIVVGKLLSDKGLTLSTAESCTGGTIAEMITAIPGSSKYFKGSVVAYSNEIKTNLLGVSPDAIRENGAVSKQVVEAMAKGARKAMNSDYSVSTSGVAGPDGGTPEKPVGTVWIAVATPEKVISVKLRLGDHRQRNISLASANALNLLRRVLIDHE